MALVGVELETLVSGQDALTTRLPPCAVLILPDICNCRQRNCFVNFLFIYMKPQNLEKSSQIHFKLHREKKDTKNTGHTHYSFTK